MEQFMVCSITVSFLVHPRFLVQCNTGAWLPRSLTAAQAASRLYSSHTQHQFGSNVAKTVGWDPSILNIWGVTEETNVESKLVAMQGEQRERLHGAERIEERQKQIE